MASLLSPDVPQEDPVLDRSKNGRSLPDGTHVIDTLTAAHLYGTTPPGFTMAAKKAGLKRYAARGNRGAVSHYWITDEVEALAASRFRSTLVIEADDIVEAPYDEGK
jgi:hypothetical protein